VGKGPEDVGVRFGIQPRRNKLLPQRQHCSAFTSQCNGIILKLTWYCIGVREGAIADKPRSAVGQQM
jgi:hypothetical protein